MSKFFLSFLFLVPGNLCAMKRALQVPEDVEILDVASSQNGCKTCIAYKGHDDKTCVEFVDSTGICRLPSVPHSNHVSLEPALEDNCLLRLGWGVA